MKKSNEKPWLNDDGKIKPEEELKEICNDWGPTIWDEYLNTLEVAQREDSTFGPSVIDGLSAEDCVGLIFSMASEEKYPLFKIALNACIRNLTTKQRYIVHQYYWEGRTTSEIAGILAVSKQSVCKTMKTSLVKLKASLVNGSFQKKVQAAKEMLAS